MMTLMMALLLSFSGEASEKAINQHVYFVDYPDSCVKDRKFPCTIKSAKYPLQFESGKFKLFLDKETAVQMISAEKMQLMQGKLWVEASELSQMQVSANLKLNFQGELFCERRKDQVLQVLNLNAQISFDSKHVFQEEALPVGFENWYGALAVNGEILRGVIKPIEREVFLKAWTPLTGRPLAELRKKVKEYLDLWSGNVEASAAMYQEVVERSLASVREKQNAQARAAQKKADEQAELRRLYREKNGL